MNAAYQLTDGYFPPEKHVKASCAGCLLDSPDHFSGYIRRELRPFSCSTRGATYCGSVSHVAKGSDKRLREDSARTRQEKYTNSHILVARERYTMGFKLLSEK